MFKRLKNILNPFKRNLELNKKFYHLFWETIDVPADEYSSFSMVNNIMKYNIIDVKSRKVGDEIEVQIITGKPGILIGKGGSNIERITSDLANVMGCVCKIQIIEHDLWKFHKY